jgi:hypothetical protein
LRRGLGGGAVRLLKALTCLLLGSIRAYQLVVSPALRVLLGPLVGGTGPRCRYYPTCSEYAYQAISRYGPFKGGRLAVMRVLRCNPWSEGGYDPVR